ncbi:hypothetical protein EMPS_09547 [Entomortierella parvispora]|uniref:Tc1-like transposase DDE domain-containing protein n=1 Tax=Entomortierella parvispora TaxID=205924 RepID=A0A9P3HIJ3_9FUNG|nr:hypothetical protein EMPS_00536 [Entomortierella parvispora]GJJ72897.1 hypothetical protein EMPS_05255 [Entomortierella parvispora]GJJ72914.1 hypothetical protein EMPS_05272 [Entomortierella parvispora]GJJ77188.1 hypothetical protein EMPS_09547 [Entomortierella parvispora]
MSEDESQCLSFSVHSWYSELTTSSGQSSSRKSILIWPVKGQLRGREGGRAADNELWKTVPDFVREAGIAPDYHDYHGNFDADLFERLFEALCTTLHEDYGPCHIHMDGAKYHVREENPVPKASSCVRDIHSWFEKNGIELPTNDRGKIKSRLELLEHIKGLNIPKTFASYRIAHEYGHTICKTPPYHCELQPIEMVWGMVKNPIAANPNLDETELSLRNRLLGLFAGIQESQLIAVWKKTVQVGRDYRILYERRLENNENYSESDDDDREFDSDTDNSEISSDEEA